MGVEGSDLLMNDSRPVPVCVFLKEGERRKLVRLVPGEGGCRLGGNMPPSVSVK